MNLTCVNKGKFANLTANKNYEGIEDGELYVVVNDIGARARYAKKYFRANPDTAEVIAPPRPAQPAQPVRPATVNLLDVANIGIETYENMAIRCGFGQGIRSFEWTFDTSSSSISCGVLEISGINGFMRNLTNVVNALPERIVNRDINALAIRMINELIDSLQEENEFAYYLLSDVDDTSNPMQEALSERADYTSVAENPNSGNNIRLWVIRG